MLAIHRHKALSWRTTRKRPSLRYRERAKRTTYSDIKAILSKNNGILAIYNLTTRNIYERFSTYTVHVNTIAAIRHGSDKGCMENHLTHIVIHRILKPAYAAVRADIIQANGLCTISRARERRENEETDQPQVPRECGGY